MGNKTLNYRVSAHVRDGKPAARSLTATSSATQRCSAAVSWAGDAEVKNPR